MPENGKKVYIVSFGKSEFVDCIKKSDMERVFKRRKERKIERLIRTLDRIRAKNHASGENPCN